MTGSSRADRVLGSAPVALTAATIGRHRFRTLAYHDIGDPAAFARQAQYLAEHWHPVSGAQVADAVAGEGELPARAVWVTFDDGRPDVVTDGLPILEEHGIPATLYVCPSVIDSGDPFWWQAIEARPAAEVTVGGVARSGRPLVQALKVVPDAERRAVLEQVLEQPATEVVPAQMDREQLDRWIASGREVGNHTWDHPILDRCTRAHQVEQVRRAHEWLAEVLGTPPDLFAYPNGDRTEVTASELFRLRYRTAPLFDHRLSSVDQEPFALSRLRLDAAAPLDRARAIVSGSHPAVFDVVRRIRGRASAA